MEGMTQDGIGRLTGAVLRWGAAAGAGREPGGAGDTGRARGNWERQDEMTWKIP